MRCKIYALYLCETSYLRSEKKTGVRNHYAAMVASIAITES